MDRHNVLASNVAHVDTPGYKPIDLRRVDDTFGAALNVQMERTHASHQGGGGERRSTVGQVFEDASAGGGADGNFVSLDREAAKVAANQLRYDTVSAIASAQLRHLAFAANDGKG
jgi:flagellar basal-body rod protein FlgB